MGDTLEEIQPGENGVRLRGSEVVEGGSGGWGGGGRGVCEERDGGGTEWVCVCV